MQPPPGHARRDHASRRSTSSRRGWTRRAHRRARATHDRRRARSSAARRRAADARQRLRAAIDRAGACTCPSASTTSGSPPRSCATPSRSSASCTRRRRDGANQPAASALQDLLGDIHDFEILIEHASARCRPRWPRPTAAPPTDLDSPRARARGPSAARVTRQSSWTRGGPRPLPHSSSRPLATAVPRSVSLTMAAILELYLVRHAIAAERGPKYPDDRMRPLTPEGAKRVQGDRARARRLRRRDRPRSSPARSRAPRRRRRCCRPASRSACRSRRSRRWRRAASSPPWWRPSAGTRSAIAGIALVGHEPDLGRAGRTAPGRARPRRVPQGRRLRHRRRRRHARRPRHAALAAAAPRRCAALRALTARRAGRHQPGAGPGAHRPRGRLRATGARRARASRARGRGARSPAARGDARRLAAQARTCVGCDLVVAWGGDGTINEVASALAGSDVSLGIVPGGSGNGLARDLGLPLDAARALEAAGHRPTRAIDAGRSGRVALLQRRRHRPRRADRPAPGRPRRAARPRWATCRRPSRSCPLPSLARTPSRPPATRVERRALFIAVANSRQYGNGAQIAPPRGSTMASWTSSWSSDQPAGAMLAQMPAFFRGTLRPGPGCTMRPGDRRGDPRRGSDRLSRGRRARHGRPDIARAHARRGAP